MPSDYPLIESTRPDVLSQAALFGGIAAKLAPVDKVRDLYRRVQRAPDGFRLETLLAEMRVDLRLDGADQGRIARTGPVVVVSNHPYGVLDGAILTVLLTRVRPDVKILTNFLLADVPELQHHCIFVDPFHTDRSIHANRKALRDALAHLQKGGMLAIFPAGEVSHWQMASAQVADPEWNDTAVRLIRRTGACALPIFFCGRNSVGFQILGMVHPRLRTAFLLQEFLQQQGKEIEVRVGSVLSANAIDHIPDDREAIDYLRWRCYLLGRRRKTASSFPEVLRSKVTFHLQHPVAPAIQASELADEVGTLPEASLLIESSEFSVHVAEAGNIPKLLFEIGRLRELTFRGVGEGTGGSRDLDRFDEHYSHVFLWNKQKQELVGAYRAGNTEKIRTAHGTAGLYTSTLFRFDERLFAKLGPSLELGRSFVRPEYQRQYAPLLLLWKGIARLVAAHPETPVLFGAVSISNNYCEASREMIYRFFESRMQDDGLAGLIQPRRPFRAGALRRWDCRSMKRAFRDLEELPINDLEADGKGLPVLLRQYAKLGGKLIGFNVDRKFSNVLDGLIVVDLRQTEQSVLERYMTAEAAARFRKFHEELSVSSSCPSPTHTTNPASAALLSHSSAAE